MEIFIWPLGFAASFFFLFFLFFEEHKIKEESRLYHWEEMEQHMHNAVIIWDNCCFHDSAK